MSNSKGSEDTFTQLILVFFLTMILMKGCDIEKEIKKLVIKPPTDAQKGQALPQPQGEAKEKEANLQAESTATPFEKFFAEYEPKARMVKKGDAFLLDDSQDTLQIDEEPVIYEGTDDLMLVIKYMKTSKQNGRTYQNPIVLPLSLKPIPGGSATKIAGDVNIGDYVVHILSANGQECEYTVTKKSD